MDCTFPWCAVARVLFTISRRVRDAPPSNNEELIRSHLVCRTIISRKLKDGPAGPGSSTAAAARSVGAAQALFSKAASNETTTASFTLSWTSDTSLALLVLEPEDNLVFFGNPQGVRANDCCREASALGFPGKAGAFARLRLLEPAREGWHIFDPIRLTHPHTGILLSIPCREHNLWHPPFRFPTLQNFGSLGPGATQTYTFYDKWSNDNSGEYVFAVIYLGGEQSSFRVSGINDDGEVVYARQFTFAGVDVAVGNNNIIVVSVLTLEEGTPPDQS